MYTGQSTGLCNNQEALGERALSSDRLLQRRVPAGALETAQDGVQGDDQEVANRDRVDGRSLPQLQITACAHETVQRVPPQLLQAARLRAGSPSLRQAGEECHLQYHYQFINTMIEPSPLGTVWCQSVMERFERSVLSVGERRKLRFEAASAY